MPGVRQLPPGHLLAWEHASRRSSERRWWSPPAGAVARAEPFEVLAAEVEQLFAEAIRTRLVADVPVGVFLSGGVDSALVAVAAARESSQRLQTFTVGYDVGAVNETEQARRVARYLDSEHHEVTLTAEHVAERAPVLLAELDQPLADQALLPLNVLSEFARPRVTVALGGEGADELFGGYPRYRWLERSARLGAILPDPAARSLGSLMRHAPAPGRAARAAERLAPTPVLERHLDWVTDRRRLGRPSLYGPRLAGVDGDGVRARLQARAGELDGASTARWLMNLDQVDYLADDVLVKTDRASMLVSLEIRTVYLHRDLAELAASVDPAMHLGGGGKALLRAMLPSDLPTSHRLGRYRKTAFRVPAAAWLRGPLAPAMEHQLEHGGIYREGYFRADAARALWREHAAGERDHSAALWPLLSLGLWVDRFLGHAVAPRG